MAPGLQSRLCCQTRGRLQVPRRSHRQGLNPRVAPCEGWSTSVDLMAELQTLILSPAGGLQAPLLGTLWAAIIIWLVRLAAIFLGSWLGAYMGGSTVEHRRRIWQGMITQVRPHTCLVWRLSLYTLGMVTQVRLTAWRGMEVEVVFVGPGARLNQV